MSKNSLRRNKDFDQVFKTGRSFYCQFFLIKFLENNSGGYNYWEKG
jgi:ribonuclease P protein component